MSVQEFLQSLWQGCKNSIAFASFEHGWSSERAPRHLKIIDLLSIRMLYRISNLLILWLHFCFFDSVAVTDWWLFAKTDCAAVLHHHLHRPIILIQYHWVHFCLLFDQLWEVTFRAVWLDLLIKLICRRIRCLVALNCHLLALIALICALSLLIARITSLLVPNIIVFYARVIAIIAVIALPTILFALCP